MPRKPVVPKPPRKPHVMRVVDVGVLRGKLVYAPCCVHADRGDKIVWRVDGHHAYSVIVKRFAGPLNWDYFVLHKGGRWIEATVAPEAKPGFYPYALVAVDGEKLLVADPEIIIPPPRGGRG